MYRLSSAVAELREMLRYARPAGSPVEEAFIRRWLDPLPGSTRDRHGNIHVVIGDSPTVLWSAHTDTVAHFGGYQTLHVDSVNIIGLSKRSKQRGFNCLGADDTAGVWLLVQMIRAKVPGRYIFHRAEERGGIGSSEIAADAPAWLSTIMSAIAFDRSGRQDIITYQYGERCASDTFARSLAAILNAGDPTFDYRPDDGGIFTDTANYTHIIGECTNVSVGYRSEHSSRETLDLVHVDRLRAVLERFDASALVYSRKPGEYDPRDYFG